MNKLLCIGMSVVFMFMYVTCGVDVAGGVENGNPVLAGTVLHVDGKASSGTIVRLIPYDNNPKLNTTVAAATVSDKNGNYAIEDIDDGLYNIIGETPDGSMSFKDSVTIKSDSKKTSDNVIKKSGSFKGVVKIEPYRQGMVLILLLGTNRYTMTNDTIGNYLTPDIPEGNYRVMIISTLPQFADTVITVDVISGNCTTVDTIELEYSGVSFDSTALKKFNDSKASLPGTYIGTVAIPYPYNYSIALIIDTDGHFSAYNTTTANLTAFSNITDDHPDNKINLITMNADGSIQAGLSSFNNGDIPDEEIRRLRFSEDFDTLTFTVKDMEVALHRINPDSLPSRPIASPEIILSGTYDDSMITLRKIFVDSVTVTILPYSTDTIIYQVIDDVIPELPWINNLPADNLWIDDIPYKTYNGPFTINQKYDGVIILVRIQSGDRRSGVTGTRFSVK